MTWSDGLNWSGNAVPVSADDVVINVSVSGPITISGTQSIKSLNDTTAALVLSSGSFTLAASSTVSKNFTESAGTLTPNGGLTGFTGAQRSRIINLTVAFDQAVLLDTGAMSLAAMMVMGSFKGCSMGSTNTIR